MRPMLRSLFTLCLVSAAPSAADETPRPDACSLIPPSEIQAIQGEAVASVKPSTPERAAFAVSQCFYALPTFTKSVSLELTERRAGDEPSARGPREHWQRLFHEPEDGEREEEEEEAGIEPPRPVAGVGDEAYWTGNAMVGALHVLAGDSYLRISIGGAEDAAVRIDKTKRLAQVALAHLPRREEQ